MAALNDVRQYLLVEGGQVAVSPLQYEATLPLALLLISATTDSRCCCSEGAIKDGSLCSSRSSMLQTQREKEEGPSSSSPSRTASRCVINGEEPLIECSHPDQSPLTSELCTQVFFVESVCEDPDVIAQNIVVRLSTALSTRRGRALAPAPRPSSSSHSSSRSR